MESNRLFRGYKHDRFCMPRVCVFTLSPVSVVRFLMDLSFPGPGNDKSMRIRTTETGERVKTCLATSNVIGLDGIVDKSAF